MKKTEDNATVAREEEMNSCDDFRNLSMCLERLRILEDDIASSGGSKVRNEVVRELNSGIEILESARNKLGQSDAASKNTGRKEELKRQHWLLSSIIDSTLDAIVVTYADSEIVFFNKAAVALFGYSEKDALGQSLEFLIPERYRPQHQEHVDLFVEVNVTSRTSRMLGTVWGLHADGREIPVEISISKSELDGHLLLLAIIRDVSEREETQRRLVSSREQIRKFASHLESIREEERTRIAREIHDALAQMLTRLKIDLAWIGSRLSSSDLDSKKGALAERVKGMNQLTDETIQTVQKIATDLRPAILDSMGLVAALEWLANDFGNQTGLRCQVHLPEDDTDVATHVATALFRIAQECLINVARHASASSFDIEFKEEGTWFVMVIRDDGIGIDACSVDDPTSLGVVGMRERAILLDGGLHILGVPGKGSTVTVRVPVVRGNRDISEPGNQKEIEVITMNELESILLVDDSEPVRVCMKGLIQELGHKVIDAGDGETGLALYKQHQAEIVLVISDMMMPKMNGIQFFEALQKYDSKVKFLLYSALSEIPRLERFKERGLLGFFQKPFTLETLTNHIGAALRHP